MCEVRHTTVMFFQAEDGIRDCCLSRGFGDVNKGQEHRLRGRGGLGSERQSELVEHARAILVVRVGHAARRAVGLVGAHIARRKKLAYVELHGLMRGIEVRQRDRDEVRGLARAFRRFGRACRLAARAAKMDREAVRSRLVAGLRHHCDVKREKAISILPRPEHAGHVQRWLCDRRVAVVCFIWQADRETQTGETARRSYEADSRVRRRRSVAARDVPVDQVDQRDPVTLPQAGRSRLHRHGVAVFCEQRQIVDVEAQIVDAHRVAPRADRRERSGAAYRLVAERRLKGQLPELRRCMGV